MASPATAGCGSNKCEYFANLRPKKVLWAALRPHLQRMDGWDATAAVTLRSGFADHVGSFPEVAAVAKDLFGEMGNQALAAQARGWFAPRRPPCNR